MLKFFLNQVRETAERTEKKFEFSISLYENDSKDDSKLIIEEFKWTDEWNDNLFGKVVVNCEDIGTEEFGSVESDDRIKNMVRARNMCLDQFGDLVDFDYVVYADIDYAWSNDVLEKLIDKIDSDDNDMNIVSAYSLHADIKRPPMELYDKWATRHEKEHGWWSCTPYTFLSEEIKLYSTFNGLCVYEASPFVEGLRFSSSSQEFEEDVEHISICEGFRERGLDSIWMIKAAHVLHFMDCNNFKPWLEHQTKNITNE